MNNKSLEFVENIKFFALMIMGCMFCNVIIVLLFYKTEFQWIILLTSLVLFLFGGWCAVKGLFCCMDEFDNIHGGYE